MTQAGKQDLRGNSSNSSNSFGLMDATFLVAGSMIGSGIFIVGSDIMRNVGSAGWFISVWVIGGIMTLIAAVSYGELAGMYPRAGGQYIYLKEAYGPLIAFTYGWSLFAVIQTGTIAAVGVSFAKFLAYFFPYLGEDQLVWSLGSYHLSAAQLLGVALIVVLTQINARGVKSGKLIQVVFTATKLLSIFGLILCGLYLVKRPVASANWSGVWHLQHIDTNGGYSSYKGWFAYAGAIASALVGAIMSYEAWNNVTFISAEIRQPKKNIGLSLLLGTGVVIFVYLLLNGMFLFQLPASQLAGAQNDRIGVAVSTAIFGHSGTVIIALLILVATFGCNNGLILAGARVYYSMARDGLFFNKAAKLNKAGVPEAALWLQAGVASVLCLSGKYGNLLDMITFTVVLFYILTIYGIYRLRRLKPGLPRPYKAFGYPVLPAVYIVLGLSFCGLLIIFKPGFTVPGLVIALAGIPIYYGLKRSTQQKVKTDSLSE